MPISKFGKSVNSDLNQLKKENEELKAAVSKLTGMMSQVQKELKQLRTEQKTSFEYTNKIEKGISAELHDTHLAVGGVGAEIHDVHLAVGGIGSELHDTHSDTGMLRKNLSGVSAELHDMHLASGDNAKEGLSKIENINRASQEIIWAETFSSATYESLWLKNKTFSPGRWAVGYQFLYVMYRVLNEKQPKSILEMGLGQSTLMLGQYAESFREVTHRVTEHDEKWIGFFKREHKLPLNTEIVKLDLGKEEFCGDEDVLVYKQFKEKLGDRKYDMISIDAPFGGGASKFSRVDVMKLIPECLADSFVIMVDDANRESEQNTVKQIKRKLEECNISYVDTVYRGAKFTHIIVSEDNRFLCTM